MKNQPRPARPHQLAARVGPEPGRIICGDALAELRKLAAGSGQLVIAAPPYFQVLDHAWARQWPDAQAYLDWSLAWLDEALRVLRDDGLRYCFGQLGRREHAFLHLYHFPMTTGGWEHPRTRPAATRSPTGGEGRGEGASG